MNLNIELTYYFHILLSLIKVLFLIIIIVKVYNSSLKPYKINDRLRKYLLWTIGIVALVLFFINPIIHQAVTEEYQCILKDRPASPDLNKLALLSTIEAVGNTLNVIFKGLILVLFFVVNKCHFLSPAWRKPTTNI